MTKCFLVNFFFLQILPEVEMASFACVYNSTPGPVMRLSILYLASHAVFDIEISLAKSSLLQLKPSLIFLAGCWVESPVCPVCFNSTPLLILVSTQRLPA